MKGRPLAQDFCPWSWINNLVRCHTGKMVGGDIADAIAGGLNRMHFDFSQLGQNIRCRFQCWPIDLQILPRGEVSVAAIVCPRYVREAAHLRTGQHAIGNCDAQHRRMPLNVQAVLQT